MKHELKIQPAYFSGVVSGEKTFEIRDNRDRNFQVGDTLLLKEWDGFKFTGQSVERVVSYLTSFEQKDRYVVLGLRQPRADRELAAQLADATRQCGVMADLVNRMVTMMVMAGDEAESGSCNPVKSWMFEAQEALAGKLPEPAVTVTETIRTAPERIWLQVGDQEHYHSEPFPSDTSEVSWCADSVVGCEVPYVRADFVGRYPTMPEGWQLVPVAPTEWPLLVGVNAFNRAKMAACCDEDCLHDALYFMLSETPKLEGGEA